MAPVARADPMGARGGRTVETLVRTLNNIVVSVCQLLAILGVTTVILAAGYLLWMFQRVMQGPITNERILKFKDLSIREIIQFVPIVVVMFWMGLYPQPFLRKMDASVANLINQVEKREAIFTRLETAPRPALKVPALPPPADTGTGADIIEEVVR